jgi:hypothetical protein
MPLCWARGRRCGAEEPEPAPRDKAVDPGTVEELVEEARFHVEFEGSRLDALRQRAGWLLALDGVIVGLIASQSQEMLDQASALGPVGRWLASGALVVAVLLVLASLVLALVALRRAQSLRPENESLERMWGPDALERSKVATQRVFLRRLAERVLFERASVDRAGRALGRAFTALVVAILAVAVYIGVFAIRTVENPSPCAASSSSQFSVLASQDSGEREREETEVEEGERESSWEDCRVALRPVSAAAT